MAWAKPRRPMESRLSAGVAHKMSHQGCGTEALRCTTLKKSRGLREGARSKAGRAHGC
jgi:hypothetical protein